MAEIQPFRGYRYRTDTVDISSYCAPPYDVLSPEDRDAFAKANPCNVVELELAHGPLDEQAPNSRYATAARTWEAWKREGVVAPDERDCLYVLEQRFAWEGRSYARTAIIAAVRLHAFSEGVVLPHERTLPKALGDRFRLVTATEANFSQVFGLYSDSSSAYGEFLRAAKDGEPVATATDADGTTSLLWAIDDASLVAECEAMLADKQVFIADGHHRYTTALAHRDALREARRKEGDTAEAEGESGTTAPPNDSGASTAAEAGGTGESGCSGSVPGAGGMPDARRSEGSSDAGGGEFVMMALANMDDPQLLVLPYNRAARQDGPFDEDAFCAALGTLFELETAACEEDLFARLQQASEPAFLLYTRTRGLALARARSLTALGDAMTSALAQAGRTHGDAWKELDVSVLQELVLEPLLHIHADDPASLARLSFSKDTTTLARAVDDEDADVAFFMRATRMDQLRAVSLSGETMPQKSTYFYPKLPSGLVFRQL